MTTPQKMSAVIETRARNERIVAEVEAGSAYAHIGRREGISTERVRQIYFVACRRSRYVMAFDRATAAGIRGELGPDLLRMTPTPPLLKELLESIARVP